MGQIRQKFSKAMLAIDPESKAGAAVAATFVGLFSIVPGIIISETLPMDDTVKPGAEAALHDYDAALDILSSYGEKNTGLNTPTGLKEILVYGGEDVTESAANAKESEEFLHLSHRFGESVIVDQRLSEKQKYDLVQEFESRIGEFESFTGLNEPDYADLDEMSARVLHQVDDRTTARDIIRLSNEKPGDRQTILNTVGLGFAGTFLFLMLIGAGRNNLKRWAGEKPQPKLPH
ncbi:MAG: hypothetical protein EP349_04650 [Alphaproteobacteria bacterium]|nr:MAG: hypothetical protein EP349_04650 [Alphaproteobacteria bacterium]